MFLNDQEAMYSGSGAAYSSTKLRVQIYKLMHELSQSQHYTPTIYKLLLIIEALQFLWWTLHPKNLVIWDINVFTWIQQFLKYFQVDGPLGDNISDFFASAVYVVFAIQIIVVIVTIINFILLQKSSIRNGTSTMLNYTSKFLSIYSILLSSILPLPFYQTFFSALFCFENDGIHAGMTCYKGSYWTYPILSIIGLIILIITTFLTTLLSIDLNPWSKIPFSAAQSRLGLLKLVFKIFIPIFRVSDYKSDYTEAFLIAYGVIWLVILVLRYKQIPYFNRSVFSFTIALEMIIFWSTLAVLFHVFFDDGTRDNMGLLFWIIIVPFVTYAYLVIVNRRTKVYRELKMKNLNKDSEVEMYVINLINLIESRGDSHKMMTLDGVLKHHVRNCMKKTNECYCFELVGSYNNEEEAPEKIWYLWIKSIIIEALDKFPKSSKLHLLYAFIQKEKLDNKFKALFELMIALDSKPNIEEEFSIFRYKSIIENEIIENDLRHIESKGIDVNLIVDFENKFVDFQTAIEAAVEAHLDFWRELLETSPEIQKLQTLGSYITKSLEQAESQYKKLCSINPNHVKMLKIYGNFLKDVVNDENEGQRIIDKAEQVDKSSVVNRQFVDDEKLKYGDNSNPCIITCSGNFTTMGIVLSANNELFKLLGYSKVEIIGQNISRIMPKPLGDVHDDIMKNYFETAKVKAIGLERVVFPVAKKGYVLPCSLMIKVLPNLSEGLKVVGFLKEIERETSPGPEDADIEKTHYIFYDGHTGSIHGVTKSCKRDFGITASLVKGSNLGTNDFTVESIFPDLLQSNLDDLRGPNGIVTVINTSTLKENYMVQNENSEDDQNTEGEQAEEENDKRYRVAQVNISLIQDEEYNDFNLRVLKFVELVDEANNSNSQFHTIGENHTLNRSNIKSDNQRGAPAHAGDEEADRSRSVDGGGSEVDSSAPGAEFNEDMRLLKDFKTLISEKTVPKSIKVLRNAVIFFGALFIALTSVGLSFNVNEVSEVRSGITAINTAYRRVDTIAEVTWKLRKLQLLATDIFIPQSQNSTIVEKSLKSTLSLLIDNLRNLTLSVGNNQADIVDIGFPQVEVDSVTVQTLIQSGNKTESRLFSDSISQMASHATSASNTDLKYFKIDDVTDSTKASFFFVRRNGLFPLREKADSNAQSFYSFYIDRTGSYDSRFLIVMIIALAILIVSEAILVPIVFSVHKTATKVLSLFGYITAVEINELAERCEGYMNKHLEHRNEQQANREEEEEEELHDGGMDEQNKLSKTSRMGQNEYLEVSQSPEEPNGPRNHYASGDANTATMKDQGNEDKAALSPGKESELMKGVASPQESVALRSTKSAQSTKPLLTSKTMNNKGVKEEDKKAQEAAEEEAEQGNARSQRLLNSKDNNRGRVIFQFTLIMSMVAAYFVADYVTEMNSQNNIKMSLDHLRLLSRINMSFKFLASFTLEEIAEGPVAAYSFPNHVYIDQRLAYSAQSLDAFKKVTDSAKQSFPSQFDSHFGLFNLYSSDNLCTNFYNTDTTSQTNCLSVAGQLLTRGLVLTTTRIAQLCDDIIKDYNSTARDTIGKQGIVSGDKYKQMEDLLNLMAPVVQFLEANMLSGFDDYLGQVNTIEKVKFILCLVFCFFLFIAVWAPYLKRLEEKIFRTKGMLNMIPMNIITRNENLKSVFIQGDILQAVK